MAIVYYVYREHTHNDGLSSNQYYVSSFPPIKPTYSNNTTGIFQPPINVKNIMGYCEICASRLFKIKQKEEEFLATKNWTVAQKNRFRTDFPYYDEAIGSIVLNSDNDARQTATIVANDLGKRVHASVVYPTMATIQEKATKGKYYLKYSCTP